MNLSRYRIFSRRLVATLVFVLGFCNLLLAQSTNQTLQPKHTGLPGRTVWALATSASAGSGTNSVSTFAATDRGLWVSANNGASWTETSLRNQAVYAIKARRIGNPSANTTTLLAGTDRGVVRSVDNGATWQNVEVTTGTTVSTSNILSLKKVFDIEVVGNFWFAATEKGVFRSNNDGRSWSLVNIDRTADNNEVRGITTDGNTIIVNLWREGLWRSTNNGNSWSRLTIAGETSLAKSVFAHTGRISLQQGNRTTTANVSMLFVGAVSGNLWRSTDNGTSWSRTLASGTALRSASSAPTGVDVLAAVGTTLVSGTPTGFAASFDNGTTWQNIRTPLPQPIALASDNQNLYVGLQQTSSATVAEKGTSSLNNVSPGVGTFSTPSSGQSCIMASVNSFTPSSVIAGGPAITVTINGTNFEVGTRFQIIIFNEISGTVIYEQTLSSGENIGGIGVTYINPNSATLSLPSVYVASASRIGVTPYAPLGCPLQAGPGYTFYVESRIPTITAISPDTFLRGSPNSTPATVSGSNFEHGAKVFLYHPNLPGGRFELATTFVNANTLQTSWSIGIFPSIGAATSVEVGVVNPSGIASPTRQTLSIVSPVPSAGGLNPSQINAGATSPLTITGTGYFEGSQVLFNGQSKAATFSNGSLTIQLTPSDIPTAGTYPVIVTNPAPGGGSTQPMYLNVLNPQAYIVSVSPTVLAAGQDATLTVSGGGSFVSGIVAQHSPSSTPLTTTFVNSNTVTVSVPASLLTTVGETGFAFRMVNPAPGGGTGNTFTMPVRNSAPVLTGISPASLVAASQDVQLTLSGSNFLAGAQVLLSGSGVPTAVALSATIVNANTITATLPAQYANAVGSYFIIVRNPDAVGDSQAQTVSVVYPQPQLSSLTPGAVLAGSAAITLTLNGANFISGAQVLWNGSPVTPASLSGSSITLNLSAAQLAGAAVHSVQVRNPQPNLGESATLFFAVRNPAPTLTALSPTLLLTNLAAPPTITLTGSGFVADSRVIIRSVATNQDVLTVQPTLTSGTQANFPFPLHL
ncbi:MAG: hypothetical protein MUF71_22005, partial [Candidatus Kapabacteria bacterium]|nr:hypothetical protein [Candidatus Kapabacteria bacterium]